MPRVFVSKALALGGVALLMFWMCQAVLPVKAVPCTNKLTGCGVVISCPSAFGSCCFNLGGNQTGRAVNRDEGETPDCVLVPNTNDACGSQINCIFGVCLRATASTCGGAQYWGNCGPGTGINPSVSTSSGVTQN